jgi:hypothetical protein
MCVCNGDDFDDLRLLTEDGKKRKPPQPNESSSVNVGWVKRWIFPNLVDGPAQLLLKAGRRSWTSGGIPLTAA